MKFNGEVHEEEDKPDSLRSMMRGLHVKFDEHTQKTERLNRIMFGDQEGQIDGLVHTVKKHSAYISNDKKMKWVGAGLAATTGATFWENIKHFFLK